MGDLLLKQKAPPFHHLPQWQNKDIMSSKHFPHMIQKPTKKDINRNNEIRIRHDIPLRTKDPSFRHSDSSFRSSDPSFRFSEQNFRHGDPPFRNGDRPLRLADQHYRHSDHSFKHIDHLHKSQDFHYINGSQDPHVRRLVPYNGSDSSGHDFQKWRETAYYPTPVISYPSSKPNGEHYFLAPYYRNVMPPPPNLQNSQRLLMVDSRKRYSMCVGSTSSSCHCRSKSMEDVRTHVVEIREDRWPLGHHGKEINGNVGHLRKNGMLNDNRRSMDNLSTVNIEYSNSPTLMSQTRVGRLQVS